MSDFLILSFSCFLKVNIKETFAVLLFKRNITCFLKKLKLVKKIHNLEYINFSKKLLKKDKERLGDRF